MGQIKIQWFEERVGRKEFLGKAERAREKSPIGSVGLSGISVNYSMIPKVTLLCSCMVTHMHGCLFASFKESCDAALICLKFSNLLAVSIWTRN